MKVVEILKLGHIWLELLQKSCVKVSDVRYIGLYEEYIDIVSKGNKKSYAIAHLAEKYGISERQVYYLIGRFGKECKICAEG